MLYAHNCLQPGAISYTYPPGTSYSLRTIEGIEKAISKGQNSGTIVEGIKGPSPLRGFLHLVDGVPADYMHCVLEGVVSWLLKKWTDSKFHSQPFSIRQHLSDIDQSFMKQHPPHEFTRPPRAIRSP